MTTLDGVERALEPEDIVIADERGRGGPGRRHGRRRQRGVGGDPPACCWRRPPSIRVSIRRTSKRLGLISEASYRFERGVDAEGVPAGRRRGPPTCWPSWAAGRSLDAVVDRYPQPVAPPDGARCRWRGCSGCPGCRSSADEAAARAAQDRRRRSTVERHRGRRRRWSLHGAQLPARPGAARGPGRGGPAAGRPLRGAAAHRAGAGQRPPGAQPRGPRPTAPAICWPAPACRRSSAGASCPGPRWRPSPATPRAGRRGRGQEPDLGRLRGHAHLAAARAWRTALGRNLSRGASPTCGCSRSGPVVRTRAGAPSPRSASRRRC